MDTLAQHALVPVSYAKVPHCFGHGVDMRSCIIIVAIALGVLTSSACLAQSGYFNHVIFDNAQRSGYYWDSSADATEPSKIEEKEFRLPVETTHFLSPPNALRLNWVSNDGGGWEAKIHVFGFPNRDPELSGNTLYFWCLRRRALRPMTYPILFWPTRAMAYRSPPLREDSRHRNP